MVLLLPRRPKSFVAQGASFAKFCGRKSQPFWAQRALPLPRRTLLERLLTLGTEPSRCNGPFPRKRSFVGRTLCMGSSKRACGAPCRDAAWLEGARYVLTLIRSNRPRTTWARPKPRTPDPRRRRMRLLVSKAPSVATMAPRAVTLQLVRDLFNQAPPPGPSLCCITAAHSTPRSAARCTRILCRQALILGFT